MKVLTRALMLTSCLVSTHIAYATFPEDEVGRRYIPARAVINQWEKREDAAKTNSLLGRLKNDIDSLLTGGQPFQTITTTLRKTLEDVENGLHRAARRQEEKDIRAARRQALLLRNQEKEQEEKEHRAARRQEEKDIHAAKRQALLLRNQEKQQEEKENRAPKRQAFILRTQERRQEEREHRNNSLPLSMKTPSPAWKTEARKKVALVSAAKQERKEKEEIPTPAFPKPTLEDGHALRENTPPKPPAPSVEVMGQTEIPFTPPSIPTVAAKASVDSHAEPSRLRETPAASPTPTPVVFPTPLRFSPLNIGVPFSVFSFANPLTFLQTNLTGERTATPSPHNLAQSILQPGAYPSVLPGERTPLGRSRQTSASASSPQPGSSDLDTHEEEQEGWVGVHLPLPIVPSSASSQEGSTSNPHSGKSALETNEEEQEGWVDGSLLLQSPPAGALSKGGPAASASSSLAGNSALETNEDAQETQETTPVPHPTSSPVQTTSSGAPVPFASSSSSLAGNSALETNEDAQETQETSPVPQPPSSPVQTTSSGAPVPFASSSGPHAVNSALDVHEEAHEEWELIPSPQSSDGRPHTSADGKPHTVAPLLSSVGEAVSSSASAPSDDIPPPLENVPSSESVPLEQPSVRSTPPLPEDEILSSEEDAALDALVVDLSDDEMGNGGRSPVATSPVVTPVSGSGLQGAGGNPQTVLSSLSDTDDDDFTPTDSPRPIDSGESIANFPAVNESAAAVPSASAAAAPSLSASAQESLATEFEANLGRLLTQESHATDEETEALFTFLESALERGFQVSDLRFPQRGPVNNPESAHDQINKFKMYVEHFKRNKEIRPMALTYLRMYISAMYRENHKADTPPLMSSSISAAAAPEESPSPATVGKGIPPAASAPLPSLEEEDYLLRATPLIPSSISAAAAPEESPSPATVGKGIPPAASAPLPSLEEEDSFINFTDLLSRLFTSQNEIQINDMVHFIDDLRDSAGLEVSLDLEPLSNSSDLRLPQCAAHKASSFESKCTNCIAISEFKRRLKNNSPDDKAIFAMTIWKLREEIRTRKVLWEPNAEQRSLANQDLRDRLTSSLPETALKTHHAPAVTASASASASASTSASTSASASPAASTRRAPDFKSSLLTLLSPATKEPNETDVERLLASLQGQGANMDFLECVTHRNKHFVNCDSCSPLQKLKDSIHKKSVPDILASAQLLRHPRGGQVVTESVTSLPRSPSTVVRNGTGGMMSPSVWQSFTRSISKARDVASRMINS